MTAEEKAAFHPVRQPLVRRHPVTGRRSLFLSAHAGAIEGWTVPEARMFLRDLTEFATQPAFVYSHEWRPSTWWSGITGRRCIVHGGSIGMRYVMCGGRRWQVMEYWWGWQVVKF